MKTLQEYIQESLLDVDDFDLDTTITNELLKKLRYWRVGNDKKTIVYDNKSGLGTESLYIDDEKINVKSIANSGLKFQPIRDLNIRTDVKNWEMLPAETIKDTTIHVVNRGDLDLTKIGWDVEAKLMINIEHDTPIPTIIPPKRHIPAVSLSGGYYGYDLNSIKGWDCDLLCILSKEDTTSITWDGFQGYNEDKIARLVENNPKAKVIYILPNSYSTEVYRVQTKGTSKNKKVSGLLPVSRKSLANRIDKYNIGTFKYMGFRQKNKELFE